MILRSYLVEETGCVSYLFGCTSKGKLGVVDPHADLVDEYLKSAAGVDAAITQVFDTHVHADHPSGAAELAERAGAALRLPAGAPVEFEFEPLRDGEIIELGNTRAEAMSTPGHAWAHSSLLVTDTIRGEQPWLVFTGDTLFVGAVGRPDLHGEERELAEALGRTLRERLMTLPDWIELRPGHVGGSACGAGISSNPSSTIGFERRNNPLATGEPPDFVDRVLAELSPPPTQFEEIYRRNRLGGSRAGVAESA
ncbi:MAG TPA: MBL fold metallo-hydrolase [Solirubrobacterales bacterium]|nr:MBL fold metallo-hydrolase [Solirubrobacterales bacterium]